MHTRANQLFGQIMYDLIRERFAEQEVSVPPLIVPELGVFLGVASVKLGELLANNFSKAAIMAAPKEVPPWLTAFIKWDPHAQVVMRTFIPMVWLSLLHPEDDRRALQVVDHVDEFFGKRKLRQFTTAEGDEIRERVATLSSQQQRAGELGAAGSALLIAARRPLPLTVASGTARTRRTKYNTAARELCQLVEDTRDLASRKGYGSQLGDKLSAELRASKATNADRATERFWDEFNLFFNISTQAPRS